MDASVSERPAAALYAGPVMHARLKPKPHRFSYATYNLVIDLDRLDEAHRASRFFSVGRFNLLSFRESDHGEGAAAGLAYYARRLLSAAGLETPIARVTLLCYPRVLGFVFNPISVYFAHDDADRLVGVIYEVRNTFGDRHSYVAPVADGEWSEAGLRQERAKLFHVSPFVGMKATYRFRIRPPDQEVALRILECDERGPLLAATFHGKRRPLTDRAVIAAFLGVPLLTLKVVVGIHIEAMKLWLKGIPFFGRPEPPPAASAGGAFLDHVQGNRA